MIDVQQEKKVTLTLTGHDRFDWVSVYAGDGHTFVVEKVTLRIDAEGEQTIGMHGPWVVTPPHLVGNGHLAVTGWDSLFVTALEQHRQRATGLPDTILVALGARGLDTALLPL